MTRIWWLISTILVYFCESGASFCFFNQDMQGHYLTQSTVSRGSRIDYLVVSILQNSIPVWGRCHRRFGNNVILYDMAGAMECMRCVHMVVRSPHILELHTEGLERCYTNEGAALTKCPTREMIDQKLSVEIMLYKTGTLVESLPPPPVYCPIEGHFSATYDVDDGTENETECPEPSSGLSNCPTGNRINIRFRRCSFNDFEKSFECLGSWRASSGQRFMALRDPSVNHTAAVAPSSGTPVPKYRCAMFEVDRWSGKTFLSFSSDSTCFNNLQSPSKGYETLVLHPEPRPAVPQIVNQSSCRFPPWSEGQWEQLEVKGNSMTFTDGREFKTFLVHCTGVLSGDGLFPVYTQNQCGDESFTCLSIEERSPNVIEFQISRSGKGYFEPGFCDSKPALEWPRWITQGRVDRFRESPCPVAGEYTGTIPDEHTLCAKLYSDCNNLEIMFYTVYPCNNKSTIYEEREYRCLGQWTESGVTYTYTERRDASGYECFAGAVTSTDTVFIAEAGVDCARGLRPVENGMKLTKKATCHAGLAAFIPPPRFTEPAWTGGDTGEGGYTPSSVGGGSTKGRNESTGVKEEEPGVVSASGGGKPGLERGRAVMAVIVAVIVGVRAVITGM